MLRLQREFYKSDTKDPLFLHHSAKAIYHKLGKQIKQKSINDFLQQQRLYTLYKNPGAGKNERNPYKVYSIDQLWEMDLISLPQLAKYNSGFVHILTCIDVFSRFAFARPLRTKQPREVVKALADIIKKSGRKAYMIQSDAGKEFVGRHMQEFLKHNNILFRTVRTSLPSKAAVIEAFNRTLKLLLARFLNFKAIQSASNTNKHDESQSKRYVDMLDTIIDTYNRTKHSRLMFRPIDVNKSNAAKVYHIQRTRMQKIKPKTARLQSNEFVRMLRKRNTFEKGFMTPLWSNEIFRIHRVINRKPYPVYELIDMSGRILDGKLYEREIQKVSLPSDTPIELAKLQQNETKSNIFKPKDNTKRSVAGRTTRVKTRYGDIRHLQLDELKEQRKTTNYFDAVSSLLARAKKGRE